MGQSPPSTFQCAWLSSPCDHRATQSQPQLQRYEDVCHLRGRGGVLEREDRTILNEAEVRKAGEELGALT